MQRQRKRKRSAPTRTTSPVVYQVEPEIWSRLPTDIKMSILQSDPTLAARVMMPGGEASARTFGPNPISLRDVRGSLAVKRKGCVGDMITVQELMDGMNTFDPQRLGSDVSFHLMNSAGTKSYYVSGTVIPTYERRRLAFTSGRPPAQIPHVDWDHVLIMINYNGQIGRTGGAELIPEVMEAYKTGDLYWAWYPGRDDTFNQFIIAFLRNILSRRAGCHPGFLRGVPDSAVKEYLQHYGVNFGGSGLLWSRRNGPHEKA